MVFAALEQRMCRRIIELMYGYTKKLYRLAVMVEPRMPLKMKVLSSGTNWCVSSLMVSCAITPPSTAATLCSSAPP